MAGTAGPSRIRCSTRDTKAIDLALDAQFTQNDWVHQNNFVAICTTTRDSDGNASAVYDARRVNASLNTQLMTQGDALYFDVTNANFILSAENMVGPVGTLLENKAAATLAADIDLVGAYGMRAPLRTLTTGLIEA